VQEVVRQFDAEADWICGAQRYERSADRVDTRDGHYERKLETKTGEVQLRIPKLRSLPFESAIRAVPVAGTSVEEALVEMHLAGVSVRRVDVITEALRGTRGKLRAPSCGLARRSAGTSRPGATARSRASNRTSIWAPW